MDLIKLYYGSDSEEENEELVQNFLETVEMSDEDINPNENFSLREFIAQMSDSDIEEPGQDDIGEGDQDEIEEGDQNEIDQENRREIEVREQAARELEIQEELAAALRAENQERADEAKFKKRTVPFPFASRDDMVVCSPCDIPMNRRSLKNHLTKIHQIIMDDDEDWDDYAETKPVRLRLKKFKKNRVTNEPEVQVVFLGEMNGQIRKKIDVFQTKDVMGLKQFPKFIRKIERSGSRAQKRILGSEKVQKELETTRVARDYFGKWAKKKIKCVICYKTKRGYNVAVWNHSTNQTDVPHPFCHKCINQWCKDGANGHQCPKCNDEGYPIKVYQN